MWKNICDIEADELHIALECNCVIMHLYHDGNIIAPAIWMYCSLSTVSSGVYWPWQESN